MESLPHDSFSLKDPRSRCRGKQFPRAFLDPISADLFPPEVALYVARRRMESRVIGKRGRPVPRAISGDWDLRRHGERGRPVPRAISGDWDLRRHGERGRPVPRAISGDWNLRRHGKKGRPVPRAISGDWDLRRLERGRLVPISATNGISGD